MTDKELKTQLSTEHTKEQLIDMLLDCRDQRDKYIDKVEDLQQTLEKLSKSHLAGTQRIHELLSESATLYKENKQLRRVAKTAQEAIGGAADVLRCAHEAHQA